MGTRPRAADRQPARRSEDDTDQFDRPLSATDEDHDPRRRDLAPPKDVPFPVLTPVGFRPFFPAKPELVESPEFHDDDPQPDNPLNPKGQPSMHLPQQATPLLSRSDGNMDPSLAPLTYSDPNDPVRIDPHATYVPYPGFTDNVQNPRGTPDYLITGATPDYDGAGPGTPSTATKPLTTTPHFDNPKNPRGISSNLTTGLPDAQAFDSQKAQNPTPARVPVATNVYPDSSERVSAGQNRAPPNEVIP
jgi:hypothetical protein